MWMTRVSINHPVFATMVMVALTVLGLFAYNKLGVEPMPDINPPTVSIRVAYPGASPEQIENDLTKPVENAVNTVAGVKRILSASYEGISYTWVEFRLDVDTTRVTQEIRDKLAQIRAGFPRDAKDPIVERGGSENDEPVATYTLIGTNKTQRELTLAAEQIVQKGFERVNGVGRVALGGTVTRQIQVRVDPAKLTAFGLTVDTVVQALRNANVAVPVGTISNATAEAIVRVDGRLSEPRQFDNIIVARRNGTPILLSQLAEVRDAERERQSLTRVGGQPAVGVYIFKTQDANIVEVGRALKGAAVDIGKQLPAGAELKLLWAMSDFVQQSVDNVKRTIIEGALLTVLIVFLFLGSWRSTVITGLTLPIAVIATFIAIYALGFTLNYMTLMALSLCIGLLIDDAIVVRENIVRHIRMGKDHYTAAREGTDEIGLAVLATTFSIVAVFVPIAFMSGIVGKFFYPFGMTVVVAVLVSLFVSFTLDPMLSAVWRDPPEGAKSVRVDRPGADALRPPCRPAARDLRRLASLGAGAPQDDAGDRDRELPVEHPDRGPGRHRDDAGERRGVHQRAAHDAGRLEPRVHRRARETRRGSAARVPGDRDDQHRHRDRWREEHRAHQPEAVAACRPLAHAEAGRGGDPQAGGRHTGGRPARRVGRPDLRRAARQQRRRDEPRDARCEGKGRAGPGRDRHRDHGEGGHARAVDPAEARARGRVRHHAHAAGQHAARLVGGENSGYWLAPDGQNYEVITQLPRASRTVVDDIANLNIATSRLLPDGTPEIVPLRAVATIEQYVQPGEHPAPGPAAAGRAVRQRAGPPDRRRG